MTYPSASQHPPPCLFEKGCCDIGLDKVRFLFENMGLKRDRSTSKASHELYSLNLRSVAWIKFAAIRIANGGSTSVFAIF